MMKRTSIVVLFAALSFGGTIHAAAARGMGINVPLTARLIGAGNTLYVTSIDVSNHAEANAQVDFYFDGVNLRTGAAVVITGSVTDDGLVAQGGGSLRARSNAHFEDFFASLIAAGMLPQDSLQDGFLGSTLFVFDGVTKSGQGAVLARFINDLAGGSVGVALRGREMSKNEPQRLVAAVRDNRGNDRGEAEVYPNVFLNHTGVTPSGTGTSAPVTVEVSAVSNSTGAAIGTPITVTIKSGNTAVVGTVLQALQVPAGSDDTILVYARVTSGDAAIHGVVSQVDPVTRDGSVFEMSRADF